MSKKHKEGMDSQETQAQVHGAYTIEQGKEFYYLRSPQREKTGILAVDIFSLAVYLINVADHSYTCLPNAEISIKRPATGNRVELHVENGSYSGDYYLPWGDREPAMVTQTMRTPK